MPAGACHAGLPVHAQTVEPTPRGVLRCPSCPESETTQLAVPGPLGGLRQCLDELDGIRRTRLAKLFAPTTRKLRAALEAEYMLDSHEITARSALARAESRGTHYREDHPEIDNDRFLKNFVVRCGSDGAELVDVPIPVTRVPLPTERHRSFSDPAAQTSRPKSKRGEGELIWLKDEAAA